MSSRGRALLVRRAAVGTLAGIAPGLVLATAVDPPPAGAALGLAFGLVYGLVFRSTEGSALDHALGAAALGVPAWALVSVTALPVLRGLAPAWTPAAALGLLPALIAWVAGGAALGVVVPPVARVAEARLGPLPETPTPDVETRIVIVGGGFAGLSAAQRLESLFGPDPAVEFTLVSETNAILFTPMLAEVAAGSLEPTHITSPLRTSLRRTRVVQAAVEDVDVGAKQVHLRDGPRPGPDHDAVAGVEAAADGSGADGDPPADTETIPYDHLVLAVGSSTNYFGLDGVREFAFDFKTLGDAMSLRNHVIDCFERADRTDDPDRRRSLVTFVIAGAGFAGAELAGALNDLVHEMLVYYPNVPPEEVQVVVAHAGERIMPALSESLSDYALERMRERGVAFRLDTRVEGADPDAGVVSLSGGEEIRTETLVWTAGVRPNPLVERLDVPHDDSGAIRADATFSVPGREGVWAVGDCAAVTDPETGERHPPTAQYATRAGTALAENVRAVVEGEDPRPMRYRSQGTLAVIGHQTACAELRGRRFSGLFAWMLWRAVYLAKLPGAERQIRVLVSWVIELFFPRDIVQTLDVEAREVLRDGR